MFHSNHGPTSYRFRDRRQNSPCILRPHWRGYWRWGQKTRMMGLPGRETSLTISSAILIQSTNVTDGWTDTGRQQRPRLRISSSGKNELVANKCKAAQTMAAFWRKCSSARNSASYSAVLRFPMAHGLLIKILKQTKKLEPTWQKRIQPQQTL